MQTEPPMQHPDERIPPQEIQPDPQLQLSEGRANGLQIAVIAFACALILGLMIYGLNQPISDGSVTASAPSPQTTGAAPPTERPAPQSGGNVAGGENAAPKSEVAQPQDQPAQRPQPRQAKPGAAEDDSAR